MLHALLEVRIEFKKIYICVSLHSYYSDCQVVRDRKSGWSYTFSGTAGSGQGDSMVLTVNIPAAQCGDAADYKCTFSYYDNQQPPSPLEYSVTHNISAVGKAFQIRHIIYVRN